VTKRPGAPAGNSNALVLHGGEGAVKKLSSGQEFVGLAHEAEQAVAVELETVGRASIVIRNARRLQAACDLFWNAVTKAAQENNLDNLDRYVARFGWLAGASLRAWAQVKAEDGDGKGATARDVLDAIRSSDSGGE
jgi:hypothetical protein